MPQPTVLITGAAAGIGLAAVRRFAAEGFRVAAGDIDTAGLAALDAEGLPGVQTFALDVRDPDRWREVLHAFVGPHGALDVLVNNAAVLTAGSFAEAPDEAHRAMVEVNLLGTIHGCRAAHPHLKAAAGAHVVNLASASALYGQPDLATYSATKFAVRGLTEALELEWRADRIAVTAIWPTYVRTGLLDACDIGSRRALGTKLTAEMVADDVFAATRERPHWWSATHRAVGRQGRLMMAANALTPRWAAREVNRRMMNA